MWYFGPQVVWDSVQITSVLASGKYRLSQERENLMIELKLFLQLFMCSDQHSIRNKQTSKERRQMTVKEEK